MIFVFGGAFISGTRDAESYRPFFEYMAREQGYTVVSIDYRLGLKEPLAAGKLSPETFPQLLPQTVLMAVEDLYDATSFVAGKSAEWGIDPRGSSPADRAPERSLSCKEPISSPMKIR